MNIYKSESTCPWATQFPKRLSKRDAKRVFDCLVECHNIALNFPAISLETALAGRALSAEPFFKFALPIVFTSLDRKIFRDILGTAFMAGNFSWAKDPVAGIFAMEADTFLYSLGNPRSL